MTENTDHPSTDAQGGTDVPHNLGRAPELTPAAPAVETSVAGSAGEQNASALPGEPPAAANEHIAGQTAPRAAGSRTGVFVAGIAAAALVGGIAGAGVTVVTMNQLSTQDVRDYSRETLTISNPDEATTVAAVAQKATPSVVTLQVSTSSGAGTGSGVIIDPNGYILTNNHVVTLETGANNATIRVVMSDGRILPGELVGTDPYADLAVVKVDAKNLPAVSFADSEKLNVGDLTVAIGAPLDLASTVTSGVISALYRGIIVGTADVPANPQDQPSDPNDLWNFDLNQEQQQQQQAASGSITIPVIQTDASINPGNSGGALLNARGQLIGINVAIASTASTQDTAGSVGLGFAIPSNLAKRVADSLIAGDEVSHGKLGVGITDAGSDAAAVQSGALIKDVTAGGPGAEAGLKAGDVVTSVNGIPVMDGTSLSALVRYHPAGTTVKIEYVRDGKVSTTSAKLGSL